MNRACLLGSGIATSLGTGAAAHVAGLQRTPTAGSIIERPLGAAKENIPCKLLADFPLHDIDTRLYRAIDAIVESALLSSGIDAQARHSMGLFIGSSSFDISVSEHAYQQAHSTGGNAIPLAGSSSFGNLAEYVRKRFQLYGPEYSFNTACTSSANALWYASRMINAGAMTHALVLGVEIFNDMTALGFHGLGLLTRSVMRPFDAARDGLVLGEAVCAAVLGPGERAHYRVLGGANLCDTYSMSAANSDGSSVAAVMQQALHAAQLSPQAIGCIKAHGTASLLNDEAEAAGLLQVFDTLPTVCAIKPFIGHTLGACGLAELLLLCHAANADTPFVPATPGIGADSAVLGITLQQQQTRTTDKPMLLNYFGFGGNNTALVIGRGDA